MSGARSWLGACTRSLAFAQEALRLDPLRTALSWIGIFLGVLTMVITLSALHGFRGIVVEQVRSFGPENLYLFRFPIVSAGALPPEVFQRAPLTLDDARALRACPAVLAVAAAVESPEAPRFALRRARFAPRVTLRGVELEELEVAHASLAAGRWFTPEEDAARTEVCVLGAELAAALLPEGLDDESWIEIGARRWRVIGILEARLGGPFGEPNPEDFVARVPYRSFRKHYPRAEDHFLGVEAVPGKLEEARAQITETLRRRRGVSADRPDDFWIGGPEALAATFDELTGDVLLALAAISAIAFAIAGIGVLNAMWLGVLERQQEIGLRKALGARSAEIALQFLLEALLLTTSGGVLATAAALALCAAAPWLLPTLPLALPWLAIPAALAVSATIGLLAGTLPALRAARFDPIASLGNG